MTTYRHSFAEAHDDTVSGDINDLIGRDIAQYLKECEPTLPMTIVVSFEPYGVIVHNQTDDVIVSSFECV